MSWYFISQKVCYRSHVDIFRTFASLQLPQQSQRCRKTNSRIVDFWYQTIRHIICVDTRTCLSVANFLQLNFKIVKENYNGTTCNYTQYCDVMFNSWKMHVPHFSWIKHFKTLKPIHLTIENTYWHQCVSRLWPFWLWLSSIIMIFNTTSEWENKSFKLVNNAISFYLLDLFNSSVNIRW